MSFARADGSKTARASSVVDSLPFFDVSSLPPFESLVDFDIKTKDDLDKALSQISSYFDSIKPGKGQTEPTLTSRKAAKGVSSPQYSSAFSTEANPGMTANISSQTSSRLPKRASTEGLIRPSPTPTPVSTNILSSTISFFSPPTHTADTNTHAHSSTSSATLPLQPHPPPRPQLVPAPPRSPHKGTPSKLTSRLREPMPLATLSGVSSGDCEFQANATEASALALSIPHDLHKSSLSGGSSSPKKDAGVGNRRSRNSSPSQIPTNHHDHSSEVNSDYILPKTSIPAIVRPLNFNNIGLTSSLTEFSSENSESNSAATFDPVATSDSGRQRNIANIVPVMSNLDGHSTGTSLLHDSTANISNSTTTQKSYDEGHTSDHPHTASNNHISTHILPDTFHSSSVYRVPPVVPIPVTPATMPLSQRLGVVAEYLSDIGYNFTGPDLTPHVQSIKKKPYSHVAPLAATISQRALPIKCLEAVVLALSATAKMPCLRFALRFQTFVERKKGKKSANEGVYHAPTAINAGDAGRRGRSVSRARTMTSVSTSTSANFTTTNNFSSTFNHGVSDRVGASHHRQEPGYMRPLSTARGQSAHVEKIVDSDSDSDDSKDEEDYDEDDVMSPENAGVEKFQVLSMKDAEDAEFKDSMSPENVDNFDGVSPGVAVTSSATALPTRNSYWHIVLVVYDPQSKRFFSLGISRRSLLGSRGFREAAPVPETALSTLNSISLSSNPSLGNTQSPDGKSKNPNVSNTLGFGSLSSLVASYVCEYASIGHKVKQIVVGLPPVEGFTESTQDQNYTNLGIKRAGFLEKVLKEREREKQEEKMREIGSNEEEMEKSGDMPKEKKGKTGKDGKKITVPTLPLFMIESNSNDTKSGTLTSRTARDLASSRTTGNNSNTTGNGGKGASEDHSGMRWHMLYLRIKRQTQRGANMDAVSSIDPIDVYHDLSGLSSYRGNVAPLLPPYNRSIFAPFDPPFLFQGQNWVSVAETLDTYAVNIMAIRNAIVMNRPLPFIPNCTVKKKDRSLKAKIYIHENI